MSETIFEPRIEIVLENDCQRYYAGETVRGQVEMMLDEDIPLSNVTISFHCIGEVKWVEHVSSPYFLNGYQFYDKYSYFEDTFKGLDIGKIMSRNEKVSIPFEFLIPNDKGLPSTMVSAHGFIQYFIKVQVQGTDSLMKIVKEVIIESPIVDNLMITVGSTVEKSVLLHPGKVWMHATVARKGWAPGETINVHVTVNNNCQAKVCPRVSLYQVQIYMCGTRHKTIQNILNDEPVVGQLVESGKESTQILSLKVPKDESLTIKSSVITVKYFLHVTLDIPHSLDLHLNLPIILSSTKVIQELAHKQDDSLPKIVAK